MSTPDLATTSLDLSAVRGRVDVVLSAFLEAKAREAAADSHPAVVTAFLRNFLFSGGKRLRPLLCVIGWHAAGGHGIPAPTVRVAASLEMFHAFALIHDDLMDDSATRRGRPTVHRAFADRHRAGRSRASADRLGSSAAILIGDVALVWSDELLHTAGLRPGRLARVLPLIDTMRTEVMYGQCLDLLATGRPTASTAHALAIVRCKTAKYTVERPLHIGAALAGAGPAFRALLSDYALPLGDAFQLRDDLLGVYGDPAVTGKSRLDDLRDGKHTTLVALALERADRAQRRVLHTLLGNPDLDERGADRIRRLLAETGAPATVEQLIQSRCAQAEQALDHDAFPPAARTALRGLARQAAVRTA
ncbi:geranylgeranyl diphosphate synthase [Streptosporangium nondiastaticum]|uniref:Geranylgeranyl diphosphate synthase n=1 Tax=Streptosporangium nondiastaticum TaxID=35764 RepID=A0A9X7JIH2_9ACTN|nr:polyprenyl synthetase family protein [Streptosporangium nondiastaticum]PSJ24282.1 geranylgeranyl diphosphate synthase [Streptosporangium nondiastaticum]